jgi:hypothetical protein
MNNATSSMIYPFLGTMGSSGLLLSKQTRIFKNAFIPTNHSSRLSVFTPIQKATFASGKPLKSFFHNALTCFANRNDLSLYSAYVKNIVGKLLDKFMTQNLPFKAFCCNF